MTFDGVAADILSTYRQTQGISNIDYLGKYQEALLLGVHIRKGLNVLVRRYGSDHDHVGCI